MYRSAYDFRGFYNSREGRVVRRILQGRIHAFWPDVKNLRLMGAGYATPYLRGFKDGAERVFAVMPAEQGAHPWPYNYNGDEKNLVALAGDDALPVETNSLDRVLLIHDLEYAELPQSSLREVWRVLKSSGRLLVIVPNRAGLWARADWSPLGQGTPFSLTQLYRLLGDNQFVHERTEGALYAPPSRRSFMLKAAGFFERAGGAWLPLPPGVHIVEASKQIYARAHPGSGSKVPVGVRFAMPGANVVNVPNVRKTSGNP